MVVGEVPSKLLNCEHKFIPFRIYEVHNRNLIKEKAYSNENEIKWNSWVPDFQSAVVLFRIIIYISNNTYD